MQAAAKAIYAADQPLDCCDSVSFGSTISGYASRPSNDAKFESANKRYLEEQKGTQENSGVIKSFTGQIVPRS
jgi:hypothetical protein